MKKLVRFLEKTYLTLKVGEVKLCLHENSKHIVLNGLEKPSLETSINLIALHAGVERGTLKMALHLKEIFVSDFVLKVAGSRPRNSAIDQSRMHGVSSASALGHSPGPSLRGGSPAGSALDKAPRARHTVGGVGQHRAGSPDLGRSPDHRSPAPEDKKERGFMQRWFGLGRSPDRAAPQSSAQKRRRGQQHQ